MFLYCNSVHTHDHTKTHAQTHTYPQMHTEPTLALEDPHLTLPEADEQGKSDFN